MINLISQQTQQKQQKQQKQQTVWLNIQQSDVAARKQQAQQKQQIFRTDMKFDDYTKFVVCKKCKLNRKNSDHDRT